jgi:hypothetical protein
MSVTIELQDVPDDVYRVLEARAAVAGMSVSDYLLRDVRREAAQPTMKEWLKKFKGSEPISTKESTLETLRAIRGE